MATKPAPLRSREVRLGVVMYGGVSLAIYIYGVAREFFDAVRGRGLFKLVKALTDSDIAVDVISGTSAGGINGILLAYCLTNELEFSAASSTWRDEGGIRALLRDPGKNIESTKSVLQGDDYFLPRLTETFERLATRPIEASSEDGDPSALSEVDLFVTSTDVDGRIETWIDAAGHPIDVKDHRTVFHLKHRAGRKEPLNPKFDKKQTPAQTFRALGKLARATSSFPAAFEPVHLAHEPAAAHGEDVSLGRWGWGDIGTDRDVYLVDGGVLDNKPFTSTIREIFYRLTERKVERKLLYVEPDPEVFERLRAVEEPNLLRVVVGSLSSIPAYESIIGDLKMLAEHNDQVERFRRLIRHQRAGAVPLDGDTMAFIARVAEWEMLAPESNGDEAPVSEGGATKHTPLPVEDEPPRGLPSSYSQSRLVAISERVVQGMLRIDGRGTQLTERERRAAARLLEAYDGWPGNGDFTLYNFDVEFRIRRMFHTLYACPKPPPGDGEEFRRARRALNRQEKLLEIIRNAMERVLDEGTFAWQPTEEEQAAWEGPAGANEWKKFAFDLWRRKVGSALIYLLDVGEKAEALLPADYVQAWNGRDEDDSWLDQDALDAVHAALGIRVARVKKALVDDALDELRPPPESFRSVLRFTDACERRILGRRMGIKAIVDGQLSDRPLIDEYANFSRVDAVVFPLQSFAGLHEQDIIKTVRISPLDAKRGFSARALDEKVSGDAVSHFGGFFKKSWRSNDILWGRLDGVCQLGETLLDPARIEEVMKEDSLSRALAESLKEDLDPARLFPRSPEPTIRTLRTWLEDVSSGDAKKRGDALKAARFDDILGLLIEAQQLEILHEEVPSVIEDAISEQTQWNSYRVAKRHDSLERSRPAYDPDRAAFFQSGDGDLDPLVAATAAGTLAQRAARRIRNRSAKMPSGARPSDTPFGLFFREKYRVGSEELTRDVPTVVLLEILSTALLVTRNCVVTLFGRRASEVRKSAAYRIISGTLWAFDGMVALLAGGAGRLLGVMAGLTVIALLALGVGITWWTAIIAPDGHIKARWLTVFILGPAALLLIEIWLLAQVAWRGRATSEDPLSTGNPLALVPPRLAPGLITVLLFIAAGAAGFLWFSPGADPGFQARFLATPSDVPSDAGKIAWYWGWVIVDYVFLVPLSLGLSLWALQVARRLAVRASFLWTLGVPLAWLALLGGVVDAVENGALLLLLSQGGAAAHSCLYEIVYTAGRACSLVKLFAPALVGLYCVVGLLWSFFLKKSAVSASPAGRGRPALRKTAPAAA